MEIIISPTAQADINYWKLKHQVKILKRIDILLEDILSHPYSGIGNPEQLKYELTGLWSRRINKEHRLVYRIKNKDIIEVVTLRFHY
ncbi:MAG: Txe/YoeB family addiction module toxin [Sediminibacterium sp.]|nr:Txe/YoeB family addiction module toxin [Sediminibacterium sp.]